MADNYRDNERSESSSPEKKRCKPSEHSKGGAKIDATGTAAAITGGPERLLADLGKLKKDEQFPVTYFAKELSLLANSMKETLRPDQQLRQQQLFDIADKEPGYWDDAAPEVLASRGLLPDDYEGVFGGDLGEEHRKLGAAYDAVMTEKPVHKNNTCVLVTWGELQAKCQEMYDELVPRGDAIAYNQFRSNNRYKKSKYRCDGILCYL